VDAPDVLTATKRAIEGFGSTDAEKKKRLVATEVARS